MGFFGKILEKLGLKKDEAEAKPAASTPATPAPVKPAATTAKPAASTVATKPSGVSAAGAASRSMDKGEKDSLDSIKTMEAAKPAAPKAISEVDVLAQLEKLSEGSGLNWKVSIVDLLKILGIDSSREARNELATELGCPADLMHDSAKMNVWLHKEVLKKIAENGGNIPQSLLD